jgi:hypothetical protein
LTRFPMPAARLQRSTWRATLWLGLPFVLGGGAIALGLAARQRHAGRLALITVALGVLILSFGIGAYLAQFVDKLD